MHNSACKPCFSENVSCARWSTGATAQQLVQKGKSCFLSQQQLPVQEQQSCLGNGKLTHNDYVLWLFLLTSSCLIVSPIFSHFASSLPYHALVVCVCYFFDYVLFLLCPTTVPPFSISALRGDNGLYLTTLRGGARSTKVGRLIWNRFSEHSTNGRQRCLVHLVRFIFFAAHFADSMQHALFDVFVWQIGTGGRLFSRFAPDAFSYRVCVCGHAFQYCEWLKTGPASDEPFGVWWIILHDEDDDDDTSRPPDSAA